LIEYQIGKVSKWLGALNIYIKTPPSNSFNRSANSIAFIENLNLSVLNARPINSSVKRLLIYGTQVMRESYRSGAIGALMDEYERAAAELTRLVQQIPDDDFTRIVDSQTKDEDCRSVQTIMSHVVRAAYGYADYLREQLSITSARPQPKLLSRQESLEELDAALQYTIQTLEGRWEMSAEEISGIVIKTRWGVVYDMEGLLEHAIVHLLRHRRQIEKFIWQGKIAVTHGV
jgi:uncharacterized damage-inducible protein DinB